jgi:dihydroflavonol-4-reductase
LRVAVTGVTGFVGTALARRLREQGHDLVGLCRARSAATTRTWLEQLGVTLVEGDVETGRGLDELMRGADLVVHCAAVIGYRRRLAGLMQRVNVLGTRSVVRAALAADVGRLVHVSSIAAFGIAPMPQVRDETSAFLGGELDAPYFDTKADAEGEVDRACAAGLDAVIVNPSAIYGPSEAVSNSSNVIAGILQSGGRVVPPGGINVVTLDSVVDGILAAAARGRCGRRYLLVGENLTLKQLVQRVGRAAGQELSPRELPPLPWGLVRGIMNLVEPWVPDRIWFTPDMLAAFGRSMWFDGSRARDELGLEPGDLDACLAATVEQLRRDGRVER